MPEGENTRRVVILTDQYRIVGEVRVGPDGSLWDFKHRAEDRLVTVYDAQLFCIADGKRAYDARVVEVHQDRIVVLFKEEDLGFMRKLP